MCVDGSELSCKFSQQETRYPIGAASLLRVQPPQQFEDAVHRDCQRSDGLISWARSATVPIGVSSIISKDRAELIGQDISFFLPVRKELTSLLQGRYSHVVLSL